MPLFADSDSTPDPNPNKRVHRHNHNPSTPRVSVPSAREELQKEARSNTPYFQNNEEKLSPAQRYAQQHSSDEGDILAPLRGTQGVSKEKPRPKQSAASYIPQSVGRPQQRSSQTNQEAQNTQGSAQWSAQRVSQDAHQQNEVHPEPFLASYEQESTTAFTLPTIDEPARPYSTNAFSRSNPNYRSAAANAEDNPTSRPANNADNSNRRSARTSARNQAANPMYTVYGDDNDSLPDFSTTKVLNVPEIHPSGQTLEEAKASSTTQVFGATHYDAAPQNQSSVASASSDNAASFSAHTANATDHTDANSKDATSTGASNKGNHQFVPMAVSGSTGKMKPAGKSHMGIIVVLIIVVIALVIGGITLFNNRAVGITLNGQEYTAEGSTRTPQGIIDANAVSVTPGNYIAVDNSVMREGEGTPATITINGEPADANTHLAGGEDVSITNGTDIMETYTDSDEAAIPYESKVQGVGALHVFTSKGEDGTKVTRTGEESGKTLEVVTKEPVNQVLQYYNVDTHGDKVACITIDDGPWDTYTEEILDILKENDAHATFYTIGDQISKHQDTVKRASDEGNEIATHTWDHAAGSGQGVSLNLMSTKERQTEVEKGNNAIKEATGKDPSSFFRAPGGNFDEKTATDLSSMIKGEIGWNIDTEDWQRPGKNAIAKRIKSAEPGEIILMHDGGGDRSQTVAALREAVPYLKEQGYELITITELIERYPYEG